MKLILGVFCIVIFSSCIQTHWLYLNNQTDKEAFVQVFTTNAKELQAKDSVTIINSPDPNFNVSIAKSLSTNSYTFVLPTGKTAILQNGRGKLDLSGKLVINTIDTIILKTSQRVYFEDDDPTASEASIIINR